VVVSPRNDHNLLVSEKIASTGLWAAIGKFPAFFGLPKNRLRPAEGKPPIGDAITTGIALWRWNPTSSAGWFASARR